MSKLTPTYQDSRMLEELNSSVGMKAKTASSSCEVKTETSNGHIPALAVPPTNSTGINGVNTTEAESSKSHQVTVETQQAVTVPDQRLNSAGKDGVSQADAGGQEDIYNMPIKFETPSEPEESTSSSRLHMSPHSRRISGGQPASRRATRKPQFTQRVWRLDVVGFALDRWRRIGASKGLCSDAEIASFLMQHYEDSLSGSQSAMQCSSCHTPLTLTCVTCTLVSNEPCRVTSTLTPPPVQGTAVVSGGDAADDDVHKLEIPSVEGAVGDHKDMVKDKGVKIPMKPKPGQRGRKCERKPRQPPLPPPKVPRQQTARRQTSERQTPPERTSTTASLSSLIEESLSGTPKVLQTDKRCSDTDTPCLQTDRSSMSTDRRSLRQDKPPLRKKARCTVRVEKNKKEQPSSRISQGRLSPRRHICGECGATFTRSGGLKVHMRIHTGEKPYKCDECGLAFNQTISLIVHKRKHSGERPFVCTECNSAFPLASTLKQHARIHSGERPFICEHCHKSFSRSGDLTSHMRVHTGLKPFLCQECGKRFASSSDLTKHKRTHTGDRPFECPECHKKFPFPHRLTAHMRSHTGDKPYLCTVCGAAFARASNLTVHFRIHTGDKPFECEECGKRFSDSGNLCKHRRTSHGGSGRKPEKNVLETSPSETVPTSSDFISVSIPHQHLLPHTASTPAFSGNPNLPNVSSRSPGADLVLRTNDVLHSGQNALTEPQPSLRNASLGNGEVLAPTFHGADSFVAVNTAAVSGVTEGVDREVGRVLKCEDCPASFSDPVLLSKHSQMLHCSIDKTFVAIGNMEHGGPGVTPSYPDVRNNGVQEVRNNGVQEDQGSLLPYLSTATLSYY